MNKILILACILAVSTSVYGCAKSEKVSKAPEANENKAKADILLNDDGNVSDTQLEQAQHVNIEVKGNGIVVITGVRSASGEVKNHELSEKDSKELLHEIVKASKGGDKQRLSALVQAHVARLQQIK